MLRTTANELKELHKKKEYELKFKTATFYNFNIKEKIKSIFQGDHLPFANLVVGIARKMHNAPKKPEFKIKLDNQYKKK